MSASLLRAAAKALRERATAAPKGPWRPLGAGTVGYPMTQSMQGTVADTYPTGGSAEQKACTDYIATMHPGVGLALADWLDVEAYHVESHECAAQCEPHGCERVEKATVVARAILGGAR